MKNQQNNFLTITRNIALMAIVFAILFSSEAVLAQHDHSKHKKETKKEKKTESIVREVS